MTNGKESKDTALKRLELSDGVYYQIENSDVLRPFFMSIVSDSNHWMFLSSNGGISAGRKNAEYALFPYYTDDKITESTEVTGSKSIFWVTRGKSSSLWEPFSIRQEGKYTISRNLYKSIYGNKVIFEEINHDLELIFRYQWSSSNKFGFVRKSTLQNTGGAVKVNLLDGIQNIVPYGVESYTQTNVSNLVDAYKRNELVVKAGLGIYALSAIIVDKAEPSEALKANIAWSMGLSNPKYLVSSLQLDTFRKTGMIEQEEDIKAEKGAYFINTEISLSEDAQTDWHIIANVNKGHTDIIALIEEISLNKSLLKEVQSDIQKGTDRLIRLVASSDGMQCTADALRDDRHFSNTLFNIMRGGIFDNHYKIEKWDFESYLQAANKKVYTAHEEIIKGLPDVFDFHQLKTVANNHHDADFRRLCVEYMPLKFSRRHGDPSRPWNRFSINTRSEVDGSKILDYEGNWRDIFQNWEALAHAYPAFIESMIFKFLNASTFDGYNPYRITKGGIDWETIEPDDAWSYIGYWGDHQIIYLLKFLEFAQDHYPGLLESYLQTGIFVYANVPYKIKPFDEILSNSKDTIDFDHELDLRINERREEIGADGALLRNNAGEIIHVSFMEKLLASLLAKTSNFIPEGGIWMNTQRPEWNDANNALVGNGVSMVTLYYMRRFVDFFQNMLSQTSTEAFQLTGKLVECLDKINAVLNNNRPALSRRIDDATRKGILDGLGRAGSEYRTEVYQNGLGQHKKRVSKESLFAFLSILQDFIDHTIDANRRPDGMYHAYNLMTVANDKEVVISHLPEMLEGQVGVLSSGYLSPGEALTVLDAQKESQLFREDQYSYLLYPKKELPGFLEKNNIPKEAVVQSKLLSKLVEDNNVQIIEKDVLGQYHFNGDFRNANNLKSALDDLKNGKYADLVAAESKEILALYEQVFNHKAFTGRSGTFYGYEGLGSIYWHMVSKLQLAVMENCVHAHDAHTDATTYGRLLEHYYEINAGIGVHKSPSLYGAFPTDPYSHTPGWKGAQQPGMTGQVKEDILSRFGELGVFIQDGCIIFDPCLLRRNEFLTMDKKLTYVNVKGEHKTLTIKQGTLCFTYCQVPIIYRASDKSQIEILFNNDEKQMISSHQLDKACSDKMFNRTGEVKHLIVDVDTSILK